MKKNLKFPYLKILLSMIYRFDIVSLKNCNERVSVISLSKEGRDYLLL